MNYLDVCTGIDAASAAWHPLGWRAVAFSEIDPFACAVLAHHYPDVPNWGDMTRFKEWPDATVDLLVGGTPCQSFSVAGLRAGLADPRGSLMLTYLAIAARYRPEWLVWENVPGVLSSDRGRAFGTLLGGLAELGYGFAYRVLDAQYFGVAQRRRRVFVVGHLGDWRRAAAVLFDTASLRGNPPPRRTAGEDVAVCPTLRAGGNSTGGHRPTGTDVDTCDSLIHAPAVSPALKARDSKGPSSDGDGDGAPLIAHALRADGFDASEDGAGRGTPLVPVQGFMTRGSNLDVGDIAATLGTNGDRASGGAPCIAFDTTQVTSVANRSNPKPGDPCHPLTAGAHALAVAFACKASGQNGFGVGDIASTQRAMGHTDSHSNGGGHQAVAYGMCVRRLTPRECERLQGFPDVHDLLRITVCEDASSEVVSSAGPGSAHRNHAPSGHVAVHVLIDSERREVQLRSQERCLWTASTAESESSYLLRMPSDAFARLAAGMKPMLERVTRTGGAESRASMTPSIAPSSGSAHVLLSGQEIAALANDAERFASVTQRFITSQAGRDSRACELNLRTLSCCVAVAISGCIPESIRRASSYDLLVEVVTPYTLIPYRNKPAADGPRYKALGNSMAVPVVRWIGRRIDLVERIGLAVRGAA